MSPTLYSQHLDLCVEDIPIEPYIYDRNSPTSAQGILPDLLKIAGQKHGIEIRYFRNPWKRCINMVKAQAIDGLFALIRNKDREWWATFSPDPTHRFMQARYKVFVAKGTDLTWDGETFDNVTQGVAGPFGYVVSDMLNEMGVHPQFTINTKSGLMMVVRNRLDGFVVEEKIGNTLAKKLDIVDQIEMLPIVFLVEDLHLAVSHNFYKANSEKMNALWQTLDELGRNIPPEIINKYDTD